MMMMTNKYPLPPLPQGEYRLSPDSRAPALYDEEAMEAYALSAIEADRKRRGEPGPAFDEHGLQLAKEIRNMLADANMRHWRDEHSEFVLGAIAHYTAAPQPAEPEKPHLRVSYDDKFDCLHVVCDSNEPIDAEEDDKGILYRRAIADGRLVGITVMNFMGQYAKWSDDVQRPAEPVKVPSDAQRWQKASALPRSWWRDAFNRIAAEGVTLDDLIDVETRRKLP